MNELLHNLVDSLREEVKQYGELLALLEAERAAGARPVADELLATVSQITEQAETMRAARHESAQRQRELAQSLGLLGEGTMSRLITQLPEPYRPLVCALVNENSEVLSRIEALARHNRTLLSRAADLMERFLDSLPEKANSF